MPRWTSAENARLRQETDRLVELQEQERREWLVLNKNYRDQHAAIESQADRERRGREHGVR